MKITKRQLKRIIKEEKLKLFKEAPFEQPEMFSSPPTEILSQLESALFAMTDWYRENADPMGNLTSGDLETQIGEALKDELGIFIQENLPESEEW